MPITGLREELIPQWEQAANEATEALLAEAKEVAPRDTGELIASGGMDEARLLGNTITSRIFFTAPQADFTNEGTPPHLIEGNPLLRFFWEDGPNGPGWYVFPSVNHPGIEATHWFDETVERWEEFVEDAL